MYCLLLILFNMKNYLFKIKFSNIFIGARSKQNQITPTMYNFGIISVHTLPRRSVKFINYLHSENSNWLIYLTNYILRDNDISKLQSIIITKLFIIYFRIYSFAETLTHRWCDYISFHCPIILKNIDNIYLFIVLWVRNYGHFEKLSR